MFNFKSKDELQVFLESRRIPLTEWGTGAAKTLDHLFAEVSSGESVLSEKDGKIIRTGNGAMINVLYHDGKVLWHLEEDKQVFSDGRERTRTGLVGSIGEKMQPGEDPETAARRALSEELGMTETLSLTKKPSFSKGPSPSPSFPGLFTVYTVHVFDVFLPDHLFVQEGYKEVQADKTSYFIWRPIALREARE